jgi:hypothetical protein
LETVVREQLSVSGRGALEAAWGRKPEFASTKDVFVGGWLAARDYRDYKEDRFAELERELKEAGQRFETLHACLEEDPRYVVLKERERVLREALVELVRLRDLKGDDPAQYAEGAAGLKKLAWSAARAALRAHVAEDGDSL